MRKVTVAVISDNKERASRMNASMEQLRETLPNSNEVLLINNGGTTTRAAIFGTDLIKVINTTRRIGLASCWNMCMENAKHEWVILCNDDLIFKKGWYQKLLGIMEQNPSFYVYLLSNPNGFSCFCLTKSFWEKVGRFRDEFPAGYYEDDDFFLRIAKDSGMRTKADLMKTIFYSHYDRTGKTLVGHSPQMFSPTPGWNRRANREVFERYWQDTFPEDPDGYENKNGLWYKEVR